MILARRSAAGTRIRAVTSDSATAVAAARSNPPSRASSATVAPAEATGTSRAAIFGSNSRTATGENGAWATRPLLALMVANRDSW